MELLVFDMIFVNMDHGLYKKSNTRNINFTCNKKSHSMPKTRPHDSTQLKKYTCLCITF